MRKLVYDIIENGKVIETTPILSKAKASGNYKTRLVRIYDETHFDRSKCKKSAEWLAAHPDYMGQIPKLQAHATQV